MGLRHPVVLLCESFGHFWVSFEDNKGSFADTQGSFAVVLGSYANIHGSCAEGCNGTRPNSTCSLSWYPTLLRIDRALLRTHRALLRMYWVLSRMYTARVHTGATALAPIQLCNGTRPNSTCSLRWYPTLLRIHRALLQMYGVLLRMYTARVWMSLTALVRIQVARWDGTQLFGGYIGLFCPYIGLFCGCIGLFCEFKLLVELLHDSLVDTKDSFVCAQLFFLADVSCRVCSSQLRTTYSLNWYTETHISFAETSGSLAD